MTHKVTQRDYNSTNRGQRIWNVVEDHQPQSEVYALRYGALILAFPTVFTSLYSQRFFIKRFKIGARSWFLYCPMIIPALGSGLIHRKIIEEDILNETSTCMGCTEFRAASAHFISASFWSFLLSSFSSCMVGALMKTVYVPPIDKYPLETVKFVGKQFRRFVPQAVALSIGNFAFTLALTHFEAKEFSQLKLRMLARLSSFDREVTSEEFRE